MQSLVNPGFDQTPLAGGARPVKQHFPNLIRTAFGLAIWFSLSTICRDAAGASFSNATPLIIARGSQRATLLSNGKLLIAGGLTNGGLTLSAAELYDPAMGIWTAASSMNASRAHHTATMLPDGKILVAAGYSSAYGALSSAELYDPIAGTWTNTGSMNTTRFFHTATLLPGGQVLVVGGT